MATLDLSKASSGVDMTDPDLVAFASTYGAGASTAWSDLTPAGHKVTIRGTGMTFDAAGRPSSGTVTSIEIDAGNDSYPDMVITGVNVAAATLDDGAASFWRFLEGDDVILGPESAQGAAYSIFRMTGDGVAARNGAVGGKDVIHSGDRIGSTFGDVAYVGNLTAADYRGGDDEILGLLTGAAQYMYGDAGTVYGGSRLTGGNDTILIQSTTVSASAAGDAAQVWSLNGALARVVGGDDYITAGPYFLGELSGDVLYQEQNTFVRGGDDTINGGNLRELISGDVDNMKGTPTTATRLIGGDDTINGNGGDDVIAGDLRLNTAPDCTVTGGDDTIYGGAGNDMISGDVYSAYPGTYGFTGGDDVIRGGGGNDRIYGDNTDNNKNTVGVGGADRLYGEDGDDRVFGQGGDDILDGGWGVDDLGGGDGADWLSGGGDDDRLSGDKGDDQIDGGAGADAMYGGADNDTYYVNDYGDQVFEFAVAGIDAVWSTLPSTYLTDNVENLSYNGVGDVFGIGNGLANVIAGGAGADILNGAEGDDVLIGGGGADALTGGAGGDYLDGIGGDDGLIGGDGNDSLAGRDGADILRGGGGADAMYGDQGDDVFDFNSVADSAPRARDVIRPLSTIAFEGAGALGGDVIDLAGIDANAGKSGNQAFVFGGTGLGGVSVLNSGADTLIRCNTDKDAAFEFELRIEDAAVLASAYRSGDFFL